MPRALLVFLAPSVLAAACATTGDRSARLAELTPETPGAECRRVGPVALRLYSGLAMPEDALAAAAVDELRRHAATSGATHLLVVREPGPAAVIYRTAITARGIAYRCPD